jgi:hypothetical protein
MVRNMRYPEKKKPYISLFEPRNGGLRVGLLKYHPVKTLVLSPSLLLSKAAPFLSSTTSRLREACHCFSKPRMSTQAGPGFDNTLDASLVMLMAADIAADIVSAVQVRRLVQKLQRC